MLAVVMGEVERFAMAINSAFSSVNALGRLRVARFVEDAGHQFRDLAVGSGSSG